MLEKKTPIVIALLLLFVYSLVIFIKTIDSKELWRIIFSSIGVIISLSSLIFIFLKLKRK